MLNRTEFMRQLDVLLQNIPRQEREEALQYYNDYFDDAGVESEKDVIEALGNPARIAENIKNDLYMNGVGFLENLELNGREVVKYEEKVSEQIESNVGEPLEQATVRMSQKSTKTRMESYSTKKDSASEAAQDVQKDSSKENDKKGILSSNMMPLFIILCVIASPVIVSIGGGILSAIFVVFISWFVLILVAGIIAIALILTGLLVLGIGAISMMSYTVSGIGLMGLGLLCVAIGLIFLAIAVVMAGVATPFAYTKIVEMLHKLKNR